MRNRAEVIDDFGRDVLSRLLYGARTSIGLSLLATLGFSGLTTVSALEAYEVPRPWLVGGIAGIAAIKK